MLTDEQRAAFMTLHGRVMAGVLAIALVVVGIQLFMVAYGLAVFFETPRVARKGGRRYMVINLLLFIIPTLGTLVLFYRYFTIWWDSESPLDYRKRRVQQLMWAAYMNNTLGNISIVVGDLLLLYRCWLIWADRIWVIIFPSISYIASIALCILLVVAEFKDFGGDNTKLYVAFYSISIALNLMVTSLIAGRLIHARRHISKLLGASTSSLSQMHRDITGASAILIESAVPLAILGLGSAIMKGVSSALQDRPEASGRAMIADYVFGTLYPAFVVLSPQMIIFRVTTGRSWIAGVHKTFLTEGDDMRGTVIGGFGGTKGLVFAQADTTKTLDFDSPSMATHSKNV